MKIDLLPVVLRRFLKFATLQLQYVRTFEFYDTSNNVLSSDYPGVVCDLCVKFAMGASRPKKNFGRHEANFSANPVAIEEAKLSHKKIEIRCTVSAP
jgi:hypothetical protein